MKFQHIYQHTQYAIRKTALGAASVAVALLFLCGSPSVSADEQSVSGSSLPVIAEREVEAAVSGHRDVSSGMNDQSDLYPDIAEPQGEEGAAPELLNAAPIQQANPDRSQSDEKPAEAAVSASALQSDQSPLNVKTDFGAIGDGITDDREAIQRAIDAAAEGLGGRTVFFPQGTYRVEEIVFLRSNTTLRLDDKATILNGINIKNHPSIVFMTGLFTDDGDQVLWDKTENIRFIGGTIDMNGTLNEEGTKAKNLPLINSSGGFALGNTSNVLIQNVTFLNSYKGHAIQIAGSSHVVVDNAVFRGQNLPVTLKDRQIITLESIQIEPLSRKGFPYALNDTGKKSEHITIKNSYFGRSEQSGELVTAIGTHYQTLQTENSSDIHILNNTFDNMMYAGVRFTGYENVEIAGNRFIKRSRENSLHYREGGSALVNAYSYNNKVDVLDLNHRIRIADNQFEIDDANTIAVRVAKDSEDYLGRVREIEVIGNKVVNHSADPQRASMVLHRIADDLTVTNNEISGGQKGISVEYAAGRLSLTGNRIFNVRGEKTILTRMGEHENISISSLGEGNFNVETDPEHYIISPLPDESYVYAGNYSDPESQSLRSRRVPFHVSRVQAATYTAYLVFEKTENDTVAVQPAQKEAGKQIVETAASFSPQSKVAEQPQYLGLEKQVQSRYLPNTGEDAAENAFALLAGFALGGAVILYGSKRKY